jgi:hypothetical protein
MCAVVKRKLKTIQGTTLKICSKTRPEWSCLEGDNVYHFVGGTFFEIELKRLLVIVFFESAFFVPVLTRASPFSFLYIHIFGFLLIN